MVAKGICRAESVSRYVVLYHPMSSRESNFEMIFGTAVPITLTSRATRKTIKDKDVMTIRSFHELKYCFFAVKSCGTSSEKMALKVEVIVLDMAAPSRGEEHATEFDEATYKMQSP